MSQVDIIVFFSLLYQFIILFLLFYSILGIWFLPILMYVFKTRVYYYNYLIKSILNIYKNVLYINTRLINNKNSLFYINFFKNYFK